MKKAQYAQARAAEKKLVALHKEIEGLRAQHRQFVAEHQLATVNCDHKLPNGKTAVKIETCVHKCKHKVCRICKMEIGRQPRSHDSIPEIPGMPAGLGAVLSSLLGPGATVVPITPGDLALPGLVTPDKKQAKKSAAPKTTADPSRN
jgi:hypothetical protein